MSPNSLPEIRYHLGYSEICGYHKFEDGKRNRYSYSIQRDNQGVEISRTDPILVSSMDWGEGGPLTLAEYNGIAKGVFRREGFFSRLRAFFY